MTAQTLALRILAGVIVVAALVTGAILLSLDRSGTARQDASQATTKVVRVDKNAKRRAIRNAQRARVNQRLIMEVRRLSRQNRRILQRFARLLVQAKIAKRTRGGITVTQAARRGARGAVGATGAQGLAGQAAAAITQAQLRDALAPLLPALIAAFCSPDTCDGRPGVDGRDAPPVSDERVREQLRMLCGGSCKGEPGANGADGAPGVNGVDGQPGAPGTLVISIETCAVPGMTATDADGDGVFTCPPTVG